MKELLCGEWRGVRPDTLRFYALWTKELKG
jgi:hypothetical protein